jgi:Fe-Mn family superoxide dismutase
MATYTLPDLLYDYGALEPHISGKIMELHHDKHHASYVTGANAALNRLAEARYAGQYDHVAGLERALSFNLSGHVLHSIFWKNMAPKAGGRPYGELASAIADDFGGFARLKKQMNAVAASIMGSGWAALVWEPLGQKLLVTQIYDHQSNLAQAGTPLIVLDAWEHAFYLQYQNRKAEFFDAVWNLWNWEDVTARFTLARGTGAESGVSDQSADREHAARRPYRKEDLDITQSTTRRPDGRRAPVAVAAPAEPLQPATERKPLYS